MLFLANLVHVGCKNDCPSPVRPGAQFEVTLLAERPESSGCHIVDPADLQSYRVTATAAREYAQGCTDVGAISPPPITSIQLFDCLEGAGSLGSYCSFQYARGCVGGVAFWYGQVNDSPVDWNSGGQFILRVSDSPSIDCQPGGLHGCTDTYLVRLDPIP